MFKGQSERKAAAKENSKDYLMVEHDVFWLEVSVDNLDAAQVFQAEYQRSGIERQLLIREQPCIAALIGKLAIEPATAP